MKESTRKYDKRCETIVSQFLDMYFYALYDDHSERVFDRELQIKGADVIVNDTTVIDEKVKLYPLNEFIKCLAFELQFKNKNGMLYDGWFVNKDSITTHYNIITAFLYEGKKVLETIDDIEYLNLLFISKDELRKYIFSNVKNGGLERDVKMLREKDKHADANGKIRRIYGHGKFWLTKSTRLVEEPINISVPRENLCKLKYSAEFCVTRIGVEKIQNGKAPIVLKMSRDGVLENYTDLVFA